jgi:hypothetical protein
MWERASKMTCLAGRLDVRGACCAPGTPATDFRPTYIHKHTHTHTQTYICTYIDHINLESQLRTEQRSWCSAAANKHLQRCIDKLACLAASPAKPDTIWSHSCKTLLRLILSGLTAAYAYHSESSVDKPLQLIHKPLQHIHRSLQPRPDSHCSHALTVNAATP